MLRYRIWLNFMMTIGDRFLFNLSAVEILCSAVAIVCMLDFLPCLLGSLNPVNLNITKLFLNHLFIASIFYSWLYIFHYSPSFRSSRVFTQWIVIISFKQSIVHTKITFIQPKHNISSITCVETDFVGPYKYFHMYSINIVLESCCYDLIHGWLYRFGNIMIFLNLNSGMLSGPTLFPKFLCLADWCRWGKIKNSIFLVDPFLYFFIFNPWHC